MAERVLCSGVFDLFHVGHLRFLQYARTQGDWLVAATLPDDWVLAHKGRAPVVPLAERLEILQALRCVDEVRVQPTSTRETEAALRWMYAWQIKRVVVGKPKDTHFVLTLAC